MMFAGVAQGQFDMSYGLTTFQTFDAYNIDGSGLIGFSNYNGQYSIDKDDIFLVDRTVISNTFVADTAGLPSLDSMQTMTTIAGQASEDRFELSWDLSADVDLGANFDPNGQLQTVPMRGEGGAHIRLENDARLRMTFSSSASGLVGENLAGGSVNNYAELTFGGDVPNPFSTGFGRVVDVPNGFVVEFDAQANDQISLDWDINFSVDIFNGQTNGLAGWNQASMGSVVIEVIPAPASGSLLALAGLAAARRRR